MKLKELKRTVNMSWSPAEQRPVMLATGSAAQQVDASFSSSSQLELYSLNLDDPGYDLELKSSLQTQHKFHKLVWSGAGILVGGCDGGQLEFYSAEKLLKNAGDALVGTSTKHSGNVSALDINPYQKNLLASGASESEIFIWDLNNISQPMAPGNRSQPHDPVQGLAWNQQVQHILGSTFATRCVVWDLRKNEPIMKLSDSQSRTRWRALAWHPGVATQLCIASEDDLAPVVQLWDLRLAASPLMTFERHQKGVMSLSWSKHDSDLLLSGGKDGQILCWNPNSTQPGGEVVWEAEPQQQWVLDVSWSPRVPSLLAASSFDHQLAVHSLLARDTPESTTQSQSNIMESFGGLEGLSQLPAVQREPQQTRPLQSLQPTYAPAWLRRPVAAKFGVRMLDCRSCVVIQGGGLYGLSQLPAVQKEHQITRPPQSLQPTYAPAWLRRPVAAKFGFGGKLVTFEKCPQENAAHKMIYVSQVVSEPEIVERAAQLDAVLSSDLSQDPNAAHQMAEYCRAKGDAASEQSERYTWFFLRANFLPDFRAEVLNLLGFKQDEIPSKFKNSSAVGDAAQPDLAALSRGASTETEAELSTDTSTDQSDAHTLIERKLKNLELEPTAQNVVIPNGEDQPSLICRALVCGNLEEAVELCLDANRIEDALLIASIGSQELHYKVQSYYLRQTAQDPVSLIAGSLLQSRWDMLVQSSSPKSWRETLAAIVTHCEGEALPHYCEMLGEKLAAESDPSLNSASTICYLCAMSLEPLVARWARGGRGAAALAGLVERVRLARGAARARGRQQQQSNQLDSVLNEYAWRLAAQGCLHSALAALEGAAAGALRARLAAALRPPPDQRHAQQPAQFNRNRTFSSQSQKRTHVLHNDSHANAFGAVSTAYEQQPWQQSTLASFPQQPGFPQPPALQPQPLQPQPLQPQPLQPALQPQPPQVQPPRPGSVGPQSGGITSRSKYKVDPSVASAPLYNQYSFNNQQTYLAGRYNAPVSDQYNASSVSSSNFAPINNNAPLNPMNPASSNPMNPAQLNPMNPAPLIPMNPAPLAPAPAVNGGYYGAPDAAPPRPVAPGWNDPPMMSSKPKPKQEVLTQAPITHPLFGVEPPQHVPLNPAPGYPGQPQQYPGQYPGQAPQYPGQQYAGQAPQYQGQTYPGQQMPGQFPEQVNPGYQQGRESPVVAQQAAPVPKPPLPEQFLAMANIFDSLRNECYNRAANTQMKRKLEDVQRRLETLYDMLRENRLSETALSCLQQCARLAAGGDAAAAAAAAAALAAGAEFATVASFLPALKVLFQLQGHLGVQLNMH